MSGPETREVDADIVKLLVNMREDICGHLHTIEQDIRTTREDVRITREELELLRNNQKGLSGQHQKFTDEILRLKSELQRTKQKAAEIAARTSDTDLKLESDMGQAIVHVGRLDEEMGKQSQAIGVIAEELGIQDKIQIDTGPDKGKEKRSIRRIRRETTMTLFSTFLAIMLLALQIVWRFLENR